MQLPTVFNRSSYTSLPPMYTWPRFVKRILLSLAVVAVFAAYTFLAGGLVAILAVLADLMSFSSH
jgi:hypothetical protein